MVIQGGEDEDGEGGGSDIGALLGNLGPLIGGLSGVSGNAACSLVTTTTTTTTTATTTTTNSNNNNNNNTSNCNKISSFSELPCCRSIPFTGFLGKNIIFKIPKITDLFEVSVKVQKKNCVNDRFGSDTVQFVRQVSALLFTAQNISTGLLRT